MKTLKDILYEGLLDDMESTLEKGNKLVDKALRKQLIDKVHANWHASIDQDTYDKIMDICDERPSVEKKGSQWVFVVPDIKNGANFKPMMVNVKKGIWRVPMDKEMYSTTTSAMYKRLTKMINGYKKYGLSNAFVISGSFYNEMFFMNEYTYVKSPNIGDDWYTYALYEYKTKTYKLLSFNSNTKEWSYGGNDNIPPIALSGNDSINITWEHISSAVRRSFKETSEGAYQNGNVYHSFLSYFLTLKKGDISEFKKNPDNWIKITFDSGNYSGNYKGDRFVYIHKTNFSVITESALANEVYDKTKNDLAQKQAKSVTAELEKVQKNGYNTSISQEAYDYIMKNYKKLSRDSVGNKKWVKVYIAGNDAKYGSFMICVDTKEWRNVSFDEFYGNGIVD
jgi:hypothetical protein